MNNIAKTFADSLWKQLESPSCCYPKLYAARVSATGRYKRISFMSRHCWNGNMILTGGLIVECTVSSPLFSYGQTKTVRLKPMWSDKSFTNAVQRLTDWAITESKRLRRVELLEKRAAKHRKNKAWTNAVHKREKRLGHDSNLATMTVEETNGWNHWLDNWEKHHDSYL